MTKDEQKKTPMKKMLMASLAVTIAATGCNTTRYPVNYVVIPDDNELVAQAQSCNVDALAEEKNSYLASTNNSRWYLSQNEVYGENTRTILTQKLNRYEAEIEASYRFVTQSCNVYMRCLERNGHNELQCKRSGNQWQASQIRFSQLSRDIREIAAEVERERIRADARRRGRHNRGHGSYNTQCCETLNNIFTDCCG